MVAHTPQRLVFAKEECQSWHSNYPSVFGHSSRDLELVVHGDDFTIGGDDFDGLMFSCVGPLCDE